MTRCPNCGKRIHPDALACRHCAEVVSGSPPPPLRTVDGSRLTWMYTDELLGRCPGCRRESRFSALPVSPADALPGAQGIGATVQNWKKMLSGGKLASAYFCQRCNRQFYVCRACQRPNPVEANPERCASCATPMIL